MPARVTGPLPPRIAKSTIAVTANRPLVVSLIIFPLFNIQTGALYFRTLIPALTWGIIEYLNLLINNLIQMAGIELVGGRALFFHTHPHLLELLQDEVDALVNCDAMPQQAVDGLEHRIVLVIADAVGIEPMGDFLLLVEDTRRDAGCGRAGWYILDHHRIGADFCTVANMDRAEHLGASPHHHTIAQRRMALAMLPGGAAQRHAVIHGHIVADLRRLADHHTHAMVDEEAPANRRARMDLDAGKPAREMRDETGQPFQLPMPQRVGQAVEDTRVQSGIAGQHLKRGACRRIPVENAGYVFPDILKHLCALGALVDSV